LGGHGHIVQTAERLDEALDLIASETFDVVVTDLQLHHEDGMGLLRVLPQLAPTTVAIVISGQATAREFEQAMRLGASRVMCKPFDSQALAQAVQDVVERRSGFQCNIHGVALVDILQVFHYERRSLTLRVADSLVHYREGEIIHAEHVNLDGEAALREILALPSGAIHSMSTTAAPVTVTRSFQSVILDALRCLDEREGSAVRTLKSSLPPDAFTLRPVLVPSTSLRPELVAESRTRTREETQRMGKIDDACKDVVASVDGAVACGVVDLDTGMLLGIHNEAAYTTTLNEVVAAATMDIFRGPNVGRIEQMVREHRGVVENGEHYFEEILITSKHNYHFARTLKGGKAVLMLVTKKDANIGLGWSQLKRAIPEVEPHVP
jgi:DNA-binding response OmpR family regulator